MYTTLTNIVVCDGYIRDNSGVREVDKTYLRPKGFWIFANKELVKTKKSPIDSKKLTNLYMFSRNSDEDEESNSYEIDSVEQALENLQVFDAHNANMSPVQGTTVSIFYFYSVRLFVQ